MQVLDHRVQIEALELLSVVELLVHGIVQRRVLVQEVQIQLIRPPLRIGRGPSCGVFERALCFG